MLAGHSHARAREGAAQKVLRVLTHGRAQHEGTPSTHARDGAALEDSEYSLTGGGFRLSRLRGRTRIAHRRSIRHRARCTAAAFHILRLRRKRAAAMRHSGSPQCAAGSGGAYAARRGTSSRRPRAGRRPCSPPSTRRRPRRGVAFPCTLQRNAIGRSTHRPTVRVRFSFLRRSAHAAQSAAQRLPR